MYDKFIKGLQKEFNKMNYRTLKIKVESRKQRNNESFHNYCLEMFKLCKEWRDDIKDIDVVNYIYDGVDPNLKSKLSPHLDLSFLDFMNKGKIYEELLDKEINIIKQNNVKQNNFKPQNNFTNRNNNTNFSKPNYQKNNFNYKQTNFRNNQNNINNSFNNNEKNIQNNRSRNNQKYFNQKHFNKNTNTNYSRNNNFNHQRKFNNWRPKRTNMLENEEHYEEQNANEENFQEYQINEENYVNENDYSETNLVISGNSGILKCELNLNNIISCCIRHR